MKKVLIMALIATGLFAVNAFAGALNTGGTTDGKGETIRGSAEATATKDSTIIGRLSKGVQMGVQFNQTGYSLNTKHLTGSKMYGTSFDSTAIYSKDSKSGDKVTAPTKSDSTDYNTGWTAL